MPVLFVLFVGLPIAEIFVLLEVGARIGFWPTVGFTILTAALGSALARTQALRVWADWSSSLSRMESPTHSVLEGVMILVGGVLLLTPGFLTDAIGFSLLIPWTRQALLRPVRGLVDQHMEKLKVRRIDLSGGVGGAGSPGGADSTRSHLDVVETTSEAVDEDSSFE